MKNTVVIFLISLLGLSSCEQKEATVVEPKNVGLSDSMLHMIETDTAHDCVVTDELTLSGEVSFNENTVVKVFPRISGQIIESKVSLGDRVQKGQALATIKSADIAASYNDLNSANADISIAKRNMDNAASLYRNGISSEKEFNEAKQNYEKAVGVKNKIQSVININGGGKTSEVGQYTLTAPIDGYIVEKKIAAGAFIRPDMAENLFTISDLKNVWVFANVYESDISRIKEGYDVRVVPLAYPDRTFAGKIDKVSQVLDAQSKALRVRINLDNKEMLLKPEMFAKVMVSNKGNSNSICFSSKALLSQDNKNYVIKYNGKNDIKVAEVDIIKTVGDRTYVRSGVDQGDVLIVKHQLFIFNQLVNE